MSLSWEASSDIQKRHVESVIPLGHLEQLLAIPQRPLVARGISTSTPHVEGHAHDLQAALLRLGK